MKPLYLSVIFYLYAKSETSTSNTLKALFDDKTPDQSYKILEKGNMGCKVSKGDIKSDNLQYNTLESLGCWDNRLIDQQHTTYQVNFQLGFPRDGTSHCPFVPGQKNFLSRCPLVPGQGQEQMSRDKTLCLGRPRTK
jgi:hypothetical protein